MRICSITATAAGVEVRVYEVDHAALSCLDLKASGVILPWVTSISGRRHFGGTDFRHFHFLKASLLTPKSRAASFTASQSRCVMTPSFRDDLSPSQGTIRDPSGGDNLSYSAVVAKNQTNKEYRDALLALTKDLREAKGPRWTQVVMAKQIGADHKDYKKWETRSLMPHRFITRFCREVGVDVDDFLDLNVRVAPRAAKKN